MVNLIWRRGRAIMVFEVWWFYEYDSCIFFSYNLWEFLTTRNCILIFYCFYKKNYAICDNF